MNERSRRPPIALRSIAALEAAKGLLVLAAACGLLSLRHTDLHAATDAFLLRHGINPERHYMRLFIEGVARATNHHVGEIALCGFAYAAVRFIESYGLWRERSWAEWFAVISAGLYLPLELTHFGRHPSRFNAGVIFVNMLIMLYLANLLGQKRERRHERAAAAQTESL
ncbi:MAG TPA: DUF2127 domain-containing protein [Patescibacteria group bacterium]|nr:DUF2127 domain-containing protein [Patescibacteria group bacterium]